MKVKAIRWRRGRYGIVYGYMNGTNLFTINYAQDRSGNYDLSSTLPGIGNYRGINETACMDMAHAQLSLFIKNLIEEG